MDYKDYETGHMGSDFWHRAKDDLLFTLLSKLNKKKLKILNLGAGTGSDLEILNKFGEVYVVDINKDALDLIPKKLCKEKKVNDACNLDYSDNFFDVIVSLNVLEHIENHNLAINESHRVLKKKGNLVFAVPAFQFLYGSHDKALEHKRRYTKKMLEDLLSHFKKLELNYWNSFLFLPSAVFRLINKNSPPKVDSPHPLPLMDKADELLFKLLKLENFLIQKNFKFPFGLTLLGIYQK